MIFQILKVYYKFGEHLTFMNISPVNILEGVSADPAKLSMLEASVLRANKQQDRRSFFTISNITNITNMKVAVGNPFSSSSRIPPHESDHHIHC